MRALFVLALLLLSVLVCSATDAGLYTDGTGTSTPYRMNATRIVSLAPNVTEMLFYLGLGDRVIGRSSFCNYPSQATTLPTVGGFTDTSLEKIVALKPDLVVAHQGNNLELIGQLRQLDIRVVALPEATTLVDIGYGMQSLFLLVSQREANVPDKVYQWRSRVEGRDFALHKSRPSVFYGMPGEVTYTAAPGSFIDDLITRAGGRNVVPKGKERWPQVGAEFILAAQPEWLLISTPCTGHTELSKASKDIRESLAQDPVWSKLKAVQQNRIVVINADVLLRPGPRILDALDQLHSALHGGGK
jgi:iron complex transport system substrate-binding protein